MIESNTLDRNGKPLAKSIKRGKVPFVSFFRVKPECRHLFNQEHKVTDMPAELYAEFQNRI